MDEMITIVDCSTGEAVDRPFTPEEQAQRDADLAAAVEAAARHQPFGLAGRIATLLAVHVIKSEVTGEPIPLEEWERCRLRARRGPAGVPRLARSRRIVPHHRR